MSALSDLQAAVAAQDTVIAGAVTLLHGIVDRLAAAGTDPVALAALTADITANATALSTAVAAVPPAPVAPAP